MSPNARRESIEGSETESQSIKIAVCGSGKVGKSALTVRFMTKRFISEYFSGIDSHYTHSIQLEQGANVQLNILDQSQEDTIDSIGDWADGFIFVYSVLSLKSFNEMIQLIEFIKQKRKDQNKTLSAVIVANKIDIEERREVTTVQGMELANSFNYDFFEISVSQQIQPIPSIFENITTKILCSSISRKRKDNCVSQSKNYGHANTSSRIIVKVLHSLSRNLTRRHSNSI